MRRSIHKIILAGILPKFLGNQAHKDIRCVQLAVKNCGNMNLCFRLYGRQKGWERETKATGTSNRAEKIPEGFVEVTEQMELPF